MKLSKSLIKTFEKYFSGFVAEYVIRTIVINSHFHFKAIYHFLKDEKRSRRPKSSKTDENMDQIGMFISSILHAMSLIIKL